MMTQAEYERLAAYERAKYEQARQEAYDRAISGTSRDKDTTFPMTKSFPPRNGGGTPFSAGATYANGEPEVR